MNSINSLAAAVVLIAAASCIGLSMVPTTAHADQNRHRLTVGLYNSKYTRVVGTDAPFVITETPQLTWDQWEKRRYRKQYWYEPELLTTNDMDATVAEMSARGLIMVGYSAFKSSEMPKPLHEQPHFTSMSQLDQSSVQSVHRRFGNWHRENHPGGLPQDQARFIGAAAVVVQNKWIGVQQKQLAERVLADDSTTTVDNSGASFSDTFGTGTSATTSVGRDGSGERTGTQGSLSLNSSSSTSTTDFYENQTTSNKSFTTQLITETQDTFDVLVTYWCRADTSKMLLGAITKTPPPNLRRAIGSRHGRFVTQVVGNTPAWDADIWEGDVIMAINGERVGPDWGSLLTRYLGQEAVVQVWREGEILELPTRFNRVDL